LKLSTGLTVKFLGIKIVDKESALKYLDENVLKKFSKIINANFMEWALPL